MALANVGVAFGVILAATPLVFWWLDSALVYALATRPRRLCLRRLLRR
jgi:hypothetical protein